MKSLVISNITFDNIIKITKANHLVLFKLSSLNLDQTGNGLTINKISMSNSNIQLLLLQTLLTS